MSSRRRNHTKKTPGSRTAHLEEKLDDLVSLIRSQAATKGGNGVESTMSASDSVFSKLHTGRPLADAPSISSDSSPSTVVPSNPHTSDMWCIDNIADNMGPASGHSGPGYGHYIPSDVAEDNLARFRHVLLRFGPVVYIPPGMTSEQLRQSRPLLWLGIMASTTRSTKEAHIIGDRIRQILSQKVLIESERSMDLLQGLLVFLTWWASF